MSKSNSISFPIMIFATWRALVCIGPYNNQLIWLKVAEIRAMNNSSLIRRIIQCNKVKNLYLKHIINKETWPHDLTDIFCILTFFFCGTFKEYSVNMLTLVHDSGFCCPIPDIVTLGQLTLWTETKIEPGYSLYIQLHWAICTVNRIHIFQVDLIALCLVLG